MEVIENTLIPLFYETSSTSKSLCALGDCLEIMRDLPDASIDMILCDLPYGTTACKWDAIVPFDAMWHQYGRVSKRGAPIVLFAAEPFAALLIASNIRAFKYDWIWVKNRKTGNLNAKKMPMRGHEHILVFCDGPTPYFPIMERRDKPISKRTPQSKTAVYGEMPSETYERNGEFKCPDSVLYFDTERGLHPTQKPVALMEYLIRTYTNEGDLILDNCMGSGTTGVACANTGRHFVGIEKEPSYFAIAADRISSAFESGVRPQALR